MVVVLLVAFASWAFLEQNFARGLNPTYSSPRQLSAADLADLEGSATTGHAFAGNGSLWFSEGSVTMVVYASPAAHDLTFVVRGLVNPTIHMASGSRISLTVVNMDPDEYHNWALTVRGPPYSSMPMMTSGMMLAMSMLGPMNNDGMWSQQVAFTPIVGQYWYLCTIGSHAAQGMYGSLVVR